jgi:oxygen-independent coproporphyrinogen III oxidase
MKAALFEAEIETAAMRESHLVLTHCDRPDERLSSALDEFNLAIRPALTNGVLPRRNPAEYRFRVTYPPTGILHPFIGNGSTEWVHEIPVQKRIALYVHVPFCLRVCTFCHFSVTRLPDKSFLSMFVDTLLRELDLWMNALPCGTVVDSIYVGGGTPTALPPTVLKRLLIGVRNAASNNGIEITVEASPGTLTSEVVEVLKDNRVTRINLGIQDLNPETPRSLGRDHSLAAAFDAIQMGVQAWPDTLNVDLIFGLPNQSLKSWFRTLSVVEGLAIPSATVYQLHIARGTPFRTLWQRQPELFADEETMLAMRWLAHRVFTSAGRIHDPIDWYLSSPKARCQHQLRKWSGDVGLVGIGPGAYWGSPTVAGRNLKAPHWKECIENGRIPQGASTRLSGVGAAARYAVFALKTRDGIETLRYNGYAGKNASAIPFPLETPGIKQLLDSQAQRLRLSDSLGVFRAEEIAQSFFDEETSLALRANHVSPYSE